MPAPDLQEFQNPREDHPCEYRYGPEWQGIWAPKEKLRGFDLNLGTCQKTHKHMDDEENFDPDQYQVHSAEHIPFKLVF